MALLGDLGLILEMLTKHDFEPIVLRGLLKTHRHEGAGAPSAGIHCGSTRRQSQGAQEVTQEL